MATEIREIYDKFVHLYGLLADERVTIAKEGEVLHKILADMRQEAKLATEVKAQIRRSISEGIQEATKEIGKQVQASLETSITGEVKETIQDLHTAVKESREVFKNQSSVKTRWDVAFVISAFLAAIIVGVLVGKSSSQRTDRELELYSLGLRFEQFWDRIGKTERNHLNALSEHHIPPEKNSIAWIIDNDPKVISISEAERRFNSAKS
jgi:hypothetical protein